MADDKVGIDPAAALASFAQAMADSKMTGDELGEILDDFTHTSVLDPLDNEGWRWVGNKLVGAFEGLDPGDIKAIFDRKPEGLRAAAARKRANAAELLADDKPGNDKRAGRLVKRAGELERLADAREAAR